MATLEDRSDDELRGLLRSDDAPTRVRAAWALAARLGADAIGELTLDGEPSSGVRRHWLTMLAGYGEHDAVRTVAEAHDGDAEGEHATVLAIRIGAAEPSWLADRFTGGTTHLRAVLLRSHRDSVEWARCLDAVAGELKSPWQDIRHAAAMLLLDGEDGMRPALRDAAIAHPAERADVFARWASEADYRLLLASDVLERAGEVVAAELAKAGRTFSLSELCDAQWFDPSLLPLWDGEASRLEVLEAAVMDVERRGWLHVWWTDILERRSGESFSDEERRVLSGWAKDSVRWAAENDWAADFPEENPWANALRAVGYSP